MLTDEQVNHFRTFGFLRLPGFLAGSEVAEIRAEFDTALDEAYAHAPFDGTRRQWLTMMGPSRTPRLSTYLEDPRFRDIAEQLFGEVVPFMVDGNRYVGDTQWHPDSTANGGIKLFLYLEPVTAATGALRVLPGSHREPYYSQVREFLASHGASSAQPLPVTALPFHAIETEPGDLAMFDFNIWHASAGGEPGRPMCTIAYYREPADESEAELIRAHARGCFPHLTDGFGIRDITPYFHGWYDNPQNSPAREELLERLERVGVLDIWQVGRDRAKAATV